MAMRWLFLAQSSFVAIALHLCSGPFAMSSPSRPETIPLSTSQRPSPVVMPEIVAPLTWSSSRHIRVQTLKPGVATHTFASLRVAQQSDLIVAVLMSDPHLDSIQQWQATALYLSEKVSGYSFSVVGMDADTLRTAIARSEVDFVVTEPGFYVSVESQYDVNRLATRRTMINREPYTVFGGVIFSRKDRDDIETLEDLAHQSFVAVDENSFEG